MIATLTFALALSVYLYFVLLRRGEAEWRVHLLFALVFAAVAYVSSASVNAPAGENCVTTTAFIPEPLEQMVTNTTCTTVYSADASAVSTLIMSAVLAVALFVYAILTMATKTASNV